MLALGGAEGRVMLVDEATGEVRWAVQDPRGSEVGSAASPRRAGEWSSTRVALSPNTGSVVASVGGLEENWKLWDAAGGAEYLAGARHDGTGACLCKVTRRGRRMSERCPVVAHNAGIRALAFSPCGQRLASGGEDTSLILWDAQTGKAEQHIQGPSGGEVCSMCFSSDGARLACGSFDRTIRVWATGSGALLRTIRTLDVLPTSCHDGTWVQFSPTDTHSLASASYDQITLWDVDSGEKRWAKGGGMFAVFSPDGLVVATASFKTTGGVDLLNATSGTLRVRLRGHTECVYAAAFSINDGSKFASASYDHTVKLWDSSTGALLRAIQLGGMICSLSWGRDWVRDTQTGLAFAMGHHPRLGEGSRVLGLDPGLVRMILDRV